MAIKCMVVVLFVTLFATVGEVYAQGGSGDVHIQQNCINAESLGIAQYVNIDDEFCYEFHLETCKQRVQANVTLSGESLLKFDITTDAATQPQQCFPIDGTGCQSCIFFKTVDMKPYYASFCPRVEVTCSVGVVGFISRGEDLPCVTLGSDCEALTCGECAKRQNCGWCAGSSTRPAKCQFDAGWDNVPFCERCESAWHASPQSCPVGNDFSSGLSGGTQAGISFFLVFGAVGIFAYAVHRRKMVRMQSRGRHGGSRSDFGSSASMLGAAGDGEEGTATWTQLADEADTGSLR